MKRVFFYLLTLPLVISCTTDDNRDYLLYCDAIPSMALGNSIYLLDAAKYDKVKFVD